MKLSTSEYFIKEVYTSFKRNIWMTLASIFTVVLSLFILGFFSIVILNLNKMADTLESQVQISVYLKFSIGAWQAPLALPKTRRLTQFSGGFDLYTASVARIVGKRNVLHFDDFHGLAFRTRVDSHFYGFFLRLFQRPVARQFVVIDQRFISAADLGNGGTDRVCRAEEIWLGDAARARKRFGQEDGAAAHENDVDIFAGNLHHVDAFLDQFANGVQSLAGQFFADVRDLAGVADVRHAEAHGDVRRG